MSIAAAGAPGTRAGGRTPRTRRTPRPRCALVTGGSHGMGLEICRKLAERGVHVVLTGRDANRVGDAAAGLRGSEAGVRPQVLDVSDRASVYDCARQLATDGVTVDILINNAALYCTDNVFSLTESDLVDTLQVNVVGAFRALQAFVPGMVQRGWGRVVNVSSADGVLPGSTPDTIAYGVSRAALNALTLVTAASVPTEVKVNAVCPERDHPKAGILAAFVDDEGAETAAWLATLDGDGPSGGVFRNRKAVDW